MKAIFTKYHGPTNTRGSRISAADSDGNRVSISYPHHLSGEDVHRKAAIALCQKMNWRCALVGGAVKKGYVFCFADGIAQAMESANARFAQLSVAYRITPDVYPGLFESVKEMESILQDIKI